MKKLNCKEQQLVEVNSEITDLIKRLREYDTDSDRYIMISNRLSALVEIRNEMEKSNSDKWYKSIDSNTIFTGAVSVLSLIMILNYEKTDIITTKAMSIANKWGK